MSEKEQDDTLADRRDAILTMLLGLPLDEILGLLAETITAVLHAQGVKSRSLPFADFEVTLTDAISGRLEAMESESRPEETSAETEPIYGDLHRAYRQTVRPLLALTNRDPQYVVTEILARLLFAQGIRGTPEELAQFGDVFSTNVRLIIEQLKAESSTCATPVRKRSYL